MITSSGRSSRRRSNSTSILKAAYYGCEALERRFLLDGLDVGTLIPPPIWSDAIEQQYSQANRGGPEATSIVWTNRGLASDAFTATFGTSAGTMRNIVDAALLAWQQVITNWNRADATTTLQVNISISGSGFGGAGAPAGVAPADGKPRTGSFTIGSGNNSADPNDSNGWYMDTVPNDYSEFNTAIGNAFFGTGTGLGSDFYSVVASELTHVLGLISDFGNSGGSFNGYLLESSGFVTNTGIADNAEGGGNGVFWTFDGPTVDHAMTSFNSGNPTPSSWGNIVHSAGGTANFNFAAKNWRGNDDVGNAIYSSNQRTIPSFAIAHVLADAYGYSIANPASFGTMYAILNQTTGNLLIRGGAGTSNDNISIISSGGVYTVSVDIGDDIAGSGALSGAGNLPAWVSNFSTGSVNSITIDTGDGNDTVTLGGGDLDTNLGANVTVTGGAGTDGLILDDTTDGNGGDDYTLTSAFLQKNASVINRIINYDTFELVTLNASGQPSTFAVNSLDTPTNIIGGAGSETFTVGGGDFDTNVTIPAGLLAINGGGGTNAIIIDDTTDGVSGDEYNFTSDSLHKATAGQMTWSSIGSITVNGSPAASVYNVTSTAAGVSLTLNGGAAGDTFNLTPSTTFNLDFDKLRHLDAGVTNHGFTYNEDGFILQDLAASSAFGSWGQTSANFVGGSPSFFNNDINGVTRLTQKDGNPFALNSISLAELATLTPVNITFTGTLVGGGTVSQPFTTDGAFGSQTLVFPGTFVNLTKVEWTQVSSFHQFDNINITAGQRVNALDGPVTVNGNGGTDSIFYDDTASTTNNTYTLSTAAITSTTSATVSYGTAETINMQAGSGGDAFNINNFAAGVAVTVGGNAGNDFFSNPVTDLNNTWLGNMTIDGGADTDTISLDDSGDLFATEYTVSATSFGVTGGSTTNLFPYSNVESFGWLLNTVSTTMQIPSSLFTTSYNFSGNDGADTFIIGGIPGDAEACDGTTILNGNAGSDTVIYNDVNDGFSGDTYTVTSTTLQRTSTAVYTYGTMEGVLVNGNNQTSSTINVNSAFDNTTILGNGGVDLINVVGNQSGTFLTVDGGAGFDTVLVNSDSAGTAAVQFNTTQDLASLQVFPGGTARVNVGGNKVLFTQALTITGTGLLDMNDNDMIVDYTTPSQLAAVQTLINSGRAGGAWTGSGITSTSAKNAVPAKNTTLGAMEATDWKSVPGNAAALFDGFSVDTSAVLVKYTYYGDTDFNGKVNFDDYQRVDAGFNLHSSGWLNGDVNSDGTVNFDDYQLVDLAFNTQNGVVLRPDVAPRPTPSPLPKPTKGRRL